MLPNDVSTDKDPSSHTANDITKGADKYHKFMLYDDCNNPDIIFTPSDGTDPDIVPSIQLYSQHVSEPTCLITLTHLLTQYHMTHIPLIFNNDVTYSRMI